MSHITITLEEDILVNLIFAAAQSPTPIFNRIYCCYYWSRGYQLY